MDLLESDLRPPLSARPPAAWAGPAAILGFLAVASALRLAYVTWGGLDLSPDEAHYWEWSRRLDLAYYSKGPLIAYLIALQTAVFGDTVVAIRLGAVLLSVLGSGVIYRLGHEAFGDRRPGALAVIGLQLTPMFWAGSLLMTIEPPFLALWTLALLFLYRALRRGATVDWVLAGLAVGLGSLAKYTMLFVLPGLLCYLWAAPGCRAAFRRAAPWWGGITAFVAFSPAILWNLRHGWVSAAHVASQGRGGGLSWRYLAEFLASQAGVLTPLVAGLLGWGLWVGAREGLRSGREPYRFLVAFGAPVLLAYLGVALQGKVQANWAVAAYPSLALATAGLLLEREGRLDEYGRRAHAKLLWVTGLLALVVTAAGHVPDLVGVPPGLDPTSRLRGWRELGAAVAAERDTMPDGGRTFLASDRYQVTSELAFYVPGHPRAYNFNLGRRLNQYDLWEGPETRLGWDAIYVKDGPRPLDARVAAAFERIEGPRVLEIKQGGRVVRIFAVYRGYGFRGVTAPPGPVTY